VRAESARLSDGGTRVMARQGFEPGLALEPVSVHDGRRQIIARELDRIELQLKQVQTALRKLEGA